MSKKFDVVIGNPPYQEEAQGGGTRDTPVYHLFMDAAYEVGRKVVLITPARFLFNAGFTPKAWNEKMLADPHLSVPHYVVKSSEVFPGTDIKAGVAVTYRDVLVAGEPIGTYSEHPELNAILQKIRERREPSISGTVTSGRAYAYTQAMHDEHPEASGKMSRDAQFRISTNAFDQLPFLFHEREPEGRGTYVQVLGLAGRGRVLRWIKRNYLTGPSSFEKFKVVIAKANGSGALGEVLSTPLVMGPGVAVTMSFLTVGGFDEEAEAAACLSYLKTKFARALLGILKKTQDNPSRVWRHVPLQKFHSDSDIDWSKPIAEIDQQLYAKYGLSGDEIAFIEEKVVPMA
ncbi:restriction endonuclease [Janibacter sp. Soil728]|uniref:Eco57I restriction-modification methylase domain-containing protein n=1 Tax=Janibacter sp. Soil728 TaxID=1736393 RepID=UPI0007013852|nr:Eco57I restriction-modification methylase domain-containing protein [Janibacter sp. Soil728]KRE35990.1 restriction endonuclease [Janibacter sp. Soil728]